MQTNTLSNTDISAIASLNAPAIPITGTKGNKTPMNIDQINKTSKDFEAVFISQMIEHMFGDSVGSQAFGSDKTGDIYKSMMMNEYGKIIANSGGMGIADMVKKELLKQQET